MTVALRSLALVTAIAVVVPATADAQLGGLIKRKIQDKAAEKVADKAVEKATGESRSEPKYGASSASAVPTFNAEILEITPPVLERFVTGYKADKAERAKMMELKKKEGDLAAARDAKEACQEKLQKALEKQSRQLTPEAQRLAIAYQSSVMKGEAKQAGVYYDSLMTMLYPNAKKDECGGSGADEADALEQLQNAETEIEKAGALAGKFSFRQYAIMRERVAAYVVSKGKLKAYSATEIQAMDAKMAELSALLGDDFGPGGVVRNRIQPQ